MPPGDLERRTRVTVRADRVGAALAVGVAVLVALSVAGQAYVRLGGEGPLRFVAGKLSLDAELTVPAFVSSALLMTASGLLVVTAVATRAGWRSQWAALAAVFAALSVDEALSFHEKLIEPVRGALGVAGPLYFAWVIPGLVVVVALGLWFVPFLLRRPPWLRRLFVASGALYVGGALGMEMVGGVQAAAGATDSWAYLATVTVEETGELAGVSLFIYALLAHLERAGTVLEVRFGDGRRAPSRPEP